MAELEIDQSNLPRVQEVCQCFAVLEDGVLAHNLQEQEIEKYYTTNIQKNQLVQNDIRIAKRLQDEEEELLDQQRVVVRQTSRQMEEQDFEYARVIQEEIQRCAEEARRREIDDEELAKQMQEAELQVRRRSRGQERHGEGHTGYPALPSPHQHTQGEEESYSSPTTRWQCSTSCSRGAAVQKPTNSLSKNQRHAEPNGPIRDEHRESLSESSDDSDAVFFEQISIWSKRLYERPNTVTQPRRESVPQLKERRYTNPHRSYTEELRECDEEREENEELEEGNNTFCDLQRRRHSSHNQECYAPDCGLNASSFIRGMYEGGPRKQDPVPEPRSMDSRDGKCRRSESVSLQDRTKHQTRGLGRTWSYRENPDKHVRFQEDRQSMEQRRVWEMLGQILIERGVPVRFGGPGAPLQIKPQSRDSQVLHGSVVSCSDSQPHQRGFQRASSTRHSFHGDIREQRRSSHWENSRRDHREDPDEDRRDFYQISSRNSSLGNGERRGSRSRREHSYNNDDTRGERNVEEHRVRRTKSERRRRSRKAEERLSSEEEQEVERRRTERPPRRALQHSQSLRLSSSSSTRERSRHMAAAGSLRQPEPSLDLRDLQQVLEDEELARKLQDEEENLLKRNSSSSPQKSFPAGDFRVAQVAQDEEIARFMQKQEMQSKRQSRELEGPASWREHRAMISHHDRRSARERHVPRERLDSEGLPSPTEDCSPENQPPSPITTLPPAQQIKNIAEELDPTFQSRRHSTDIVRVGLTGPSCPSPPTQLSDFVEEPTFIPPTKRPTEKSSRVKPKEKKENCKQQ
ncbi:coiled-coil domain-containing protein 187 [Gouania willdenowi]|uniref:Trichohyalin-like n=1 Tax=Gouania willdenowi TaxID=441366 RepID=A0A8C5D5T2_GOUWI|nr:trichohyalin-like [Gouania willdenowi]XP_028308702.1 trichohyalin-like [Gouania willdenowi]